MSTTDAPIERSISERTVSVWDDRLRIRVEIQGEGDPVLYLHPAGGLMWDGFLDDLARDHAVYAPVFPGLTPGDERAIDALDDVFDVVLAYEELVRELGIGGAVVVGQSFGGMLAAELASTFPQLFSRVVLLDPVGLWFDSDPYAMEFMACPPERVPSLLFHDLTCPAAQAMLNPPDDPQLAIEIAVGVVWALGCTAKFLWPIPDRGLHKRLHRLTAPTLIAWGSEDRIVPVSYAEHFAARISDSRVHVFPGCGHVPQLERTDETIEAVRSFLR